jgi:flagellar basal-body rod protein FlgG
MAIIALHSSATGLSALSTSLDVIANNLANANTEGFKASRTNFQDLLYQERAQPGLESSNGDQRPTGLYIGLGTKVSGTQLDLKPGAALNTSQPFDLLIDGDGFFQVEVEPDLGGGIAYTRAGNFVRNAEGQLVLANDVGRRLIPEITIPEGASSPSIRTDGTVEVILPGETEPTEVGQIEIATFVNAAGLKAIGENLFITTAASGDAIVGEPGTESLGVLRQGFLEGSNVDPVVELVNLIRTQRAFEFNSQSLKAADEALQTINNLPRL